MYFVVECTTRSAPSAIGCCQTGLRKVLSTATSAPAPRAAAATAAMSVMRNSGLLGVSIHTSRGFVSSARASAGGSVMSTNSTTALPVRCSAASRR
jgi:hypothetical protein